MPFPSISPQSHLRTVAKTSEIYIQQPVSIAAKRMQNYHRKLKLDPDKYKKYLQAAADRNRAARAKRSRVQKDHDNSLSYERTKRFRQRQKDAKAAVAIQTNATKNLRKPITQNELLKTKVEQNTKREYWKIKKREERDKISPQQKQSIRQKRKLKRQEMREKTLSICALKISKNSLKNGSTTDGNPVTSSQPYTDLNSTVKALSRALKCPPKNASKLDEVVSLLVHRATPRIQKALIVKGLVYENKNPKPGKSLAEGKTKIIYDLPDESGHVLIQSKDRITAGDGARAHDLQGKAAISNASTCKVFEYLSSIGIKNHFIRQTSSTAFIAQQCHMLPIEWVTRRVATGSFLKRNPGVKEGFRFVPIKLEIFYKDDANHDPQWSFEQLIDAKLSFCGVLIGQHEVDVISKTTVAVFEVLEKAWAHLNCSLIDMKIEFGVIPKTGQIVVADIIDSDSWRLWPLGDRRLMKDKQVYRELKEVTSEALEQVKKNFEWISEKLENFIVKPHAQVVILMGSSSDLDHCEKIRNSCKSLGIPCELRITSAHKGSPDTLHIIAEYEALNIATVFIAVAGCSNGLGPVTSGNTSFPVINCPPVSENWGPQDIWSSLRLPSGLGCCTVLSPDGAALCAAQMIALSDHVIWSRLRAKQLNTAISLKEADRKVRNDK